VAATLLVALAVVAVGAMVALDAGGPAHSPPIAAALPGTDDAPAAGMPASSLQAIEPTPDTLPSQRPAGSTAVEPADRAPGDGRVEAGPASLTEVDDDVDTREAEPSDAAERRDPPARPRSGWVCDEAIRVTDTRGGRWSVDRVSFRAMGAYERVVLHLDRQGPGGAAATASGKAFATSAVEAFAPAAARPTSGRMTIGIELGGGIRGGLELRRFRPQGLQTIRELSIYRSGPESRVLISVASDGCFRMRAPAWGSRSGDATTAQLIVDVRR
jgi:hypothetical protein